MKNELNAPAASRTLFISEGTCAAILVTATATTQSKRSMAFADPPAALAWARAHRAMLVYTPSTAHEKN